MDPQLVSLVATILGGTSALASIAFSAWLSRRQLEFQKEAEERARRYQIALLVAPRRLEALQNLWMALYVVERDGPAAMNVDQVVIDAVLVDSGIRTAAVDLASRINRGEAVSGAELSNLRKLIIQAVGADAIRGGAVDHVGVR